MNIYALIILTTIIISYILDLIADRLNLKSLDPRLPQEFEGYFDQEKYARSQEYTRVRTNFSFYVTTISLAITLTFWFAGGFNLLDQWVRGFNLPVIWTGLIYIASLMVLKSVVSLPFSIYSTFVIEEKFGFNRTTVKTFILDMIKGIALGIILGGPLLAGIIAFFEYGGEWAWLYAWAAVTFFSLIVTFIAPTWIMPLFNKFTPLEDNDLRKAIFEYADKVRFSLKNVFVMDGSKRSSKSNAFFTGFGKNKRIALFDTLIEKHTVPELVSVLAHEIGHYKKKHIIKGMLAGIVQTGIMFYLLSIFLTHDGLFQAFYMHTGSVYTGLIFFGMLYAPVDEILSVFMSMISRKHEYEADRFAAETTGENMSLVESLKKLSVHNLSNLTPHPFYVFLNYSHPPVLERIQALKSIKID